MARLISVLGCLILACVGSGCAASLGSFDTMGFIHEEYPYTVDYRDAQKQTFISSDWRLDNFYNERGKLQPKQGPEYQTKTYFDANGDGTYEQAQKLYVYDMSFEHLQREQKIWLRTLPVDANDARKNLDVIMRDYIAAISGSGYAVVSLSDKSMRVIEKRYATKIVGQKALKLADRDALVVVIDVSNVDQLQVKSEDGNQRVALLFVRSGYEHRVNMGGFPVIMVAGYASHPADFAGGIGAFEYFTSRISLRAGASRRRPGGGEAISEEDVRARPGKSLAIPQGTVASLSQAPAVEPAPAPVPTTPAPQPMPATPDVAVPPPAVTPVPEPAAAAEPSS